MNRVIHLWPDGPPTTIENVPAEVAYTVKDGLAAGHTFFRNISDATLTVFDPVGPATGVGVIVVPGGGWTINAWGHEGLGVAEWLTALGHTVFVLKYRLQASPADQDEFEARWAGADAIHAQPVPYSSKPTAISDLVSTSRYLEARASCADDGRRAIEVVRAEAGRYGLRPGCIGMIGFSAGAFLTVDVALDPRAEQLAFIAPIYGGETRGAPVPADAPPLFTAVAQDDILVRIVQRLQADWTAADRPCEYHEFAKGGHGFGVIQQGLPSDRWTDLFTAWMTSVLPAG